MRIDPKVEEPTRELFGFAIRAELDEFQQKLASFDDDESVRLALQLANAVAAGVVLEICDGARPSDPDLRQLAETAERVETRYRLAEAEVHDYLARCVFGGEQLFDVFNAADAVRMPFIITGHLLGSYTHVDQGQHWPAYLDQIEAALEAAPEPSS